MLVTYTYLAPVIFRAFGDGSVSADDMPKVPKEHTAETLAANGLPVMTSSVHTDVYLTKCRNWIPFCSGESDTFSGVSSPHSVRQSVQRTMSLIISIFFEQVDSFSHASSGSKLECVRSTYL